MKEGWKVQALGDIAIIFNGNSINADEKKKKYEGLSEGFPFIATKDVSFDGVVDYDNGIRIPYTTDFKIAKAGSVFVCAEGGSAGRKVAFLNRDVCFGNKLFAIESKGSVIGKYIYYYTQSDYFKEQFRGLMVGIIGGVSIKKFNLIPISFPNTPEQHRIVGLLDAAFEKIDALKANAEKNLNNAKALFQQVLAKELEPKQGWETRYLGNLCDTSAGGTPLKTSKEYYECGDIPWIRSGEVCRKHITESEMYITEAGLNNSSAKLFPAHTVLIAMYGATAGQVGILDFESSTNQAVCGILPNDQYLPDYLYYYLLSYKDRLVATAVGNAQPNISQQKIKTIPLPLIGREVQKEIVNTVEGLDAKCHQLEEVAQKTIAECDALKQSILRQAFNGEL